MFSFLKKKDKVSQPIFDYSVIQVDMHSHVLPGIDDGASTPDESIVLIKKMMELGIKKVIATPHIMVDYYKNNSSTINAALAVLKAELQSQQIDIIVEAAAEHYFDETFEQQIDEGNLMVMPKNYVLFELSFISKPPNLIDVINKLQSFHYRPILAHPERYSYMDLGQFKKIHDRGVSFQLNTISLTGYYGKDAKKLAEGLIDLQLVDFISSDMHHLRHAEAFKNALSMPYVEKLLSGYPLKNTSLL
jgi:tyrosine-protein phosphatase YwqE